MLIAEKSIGLGTTFSESETRVLGRYINFKLAMLGLPVADVFADPEVEELTAAFLQRQLETQRLLANYLCPADQRIQGFLNDYLKQTGVNVSLPSRTLVLDRHGLARVLSLPSDGDKYASDLIESYRVRQGVLHNPRNDRRTTEGVFHVAEGGLPVPDDKRAVPVAVFARLLQRALAPPSTMLRLPFTSGQEQQAECLVSLLLRPLVCPAVPGFVTEKRLEIRFFAPGGLVSNLDFVESIFGNSGDPYLPENDAGLDVEHWTGHTGCVILAPHLVHCTKEELGLPHWDKATERQRRDGMCWKDADERYNGGSAFKVTARDATGVMVTLIADNYFGYCKKEVKTQISYAANLYGLTEEEHAGGALVYPSYDLGEDFSGQHVAHPGHAFDEATKLIGARMDLHPDGYAVDKTYPDIFYVPESAHFDLLRQTVSWPHNGGVSTLGLMQGKTYILPQGYRVHMEKPSPTRAWRLVGTIAEPTLCHKPCTVSGGGKSEISKSISDSIIQGPVFIADFERDMDAVHEIVLRDYSDRFREKLPEPRRPASRPVLSPERSLGSVIKLLTPSDEYTNAYNAWLESIPQYIKELVFVVKRCYRPEWGQDWRRHFSVDIVNGKPGNELKFDNRKLVTTLMRVGYDAGGSWRTFGLRKDFHPAQKIQVEDDITASVVVPTGHVHDLNPAYSGAPALKFVQNCEYRLFQRPDDAIHRGYDRQTEADFARPGNFFSNYEPLTATAARALTEDSIGLDQYTPPMRDLINAFHREGVPTYMVSTAQPRRVDGKPTKNPRYLQTRPDLVNPRSVYVAEMCTRLHRKIPVYRPVLTPVNAVLPGRRNNPSDPAAGIRSLAVFNPIHHLELPELFMEFICSMTGKSPSTTGAGSEGALTKGPFNALPPIIDLNNALVSTLLTDHHAFVTAAGFVGPKARVDHDISLLVPEIWSRMSVAERDPRYLIANGHLEKCVDTTHRGKPVLASRLGYRITRRFVIRFFGRIFNHPHEVCTDEMLRPELQDPDVFADGMDNIVATQRRVAQAYFDDGSVAEACPPLRALLHIMRDDAWEGRGLDDPVVRAMFTREHMLSSDWYADRLRAKQDRETQLWHRHVEYLESFLTKPNYAGEARRLQIQQRLANACQRLQRVDAPDYLKFISGTIGAHPIRSA
jgi:hypothetical protein